MAEGAFLVRTIPKLRGQVFMLLNGLQRVWWTHLLTVGYTCSLVYPYRYVLLAVK